VVWWSIPLLATAIAIAWLSWRARPRPGDPHDTVEERRRFNEAMQKSPRRRRRAGRPPTDTLDDPATDSEESPT